MSKLSREEFESILEECFIEGYNSALEDIQEDILDEEAYDLERDYEYYTESNAETKARNREIRNKILNSNNNNNAVISGKPGKEDSKSIYMQGKNKAAVKINPNGKHYINDFGRQQQHDLSDPKADRLDYMTNVHDKIKNASPDVKKNAIRSLKKVLTDNAKTRSDGEDTEVKSRIYGNTNRSDLLKYGKVYNRH